MGQAGLRCQYICPQESLITALKANNVALAIAIQSSIRHAYPIKKNLLNSNEYLTINQSGAFFARAIYTTLIDVYDVNFYAIRPWTNHLPDDSSNSSENLHNSLDEFLSMSD